MTDAFSSTPRFRYQIESKAVAHGRFAWSVYEERSDGRKVVLASGVMFPEPGNGLDHEALVSFVQSVERRRVAH